MNKIYKVIWSKEKNQYVVASELAHNNGKQSKTVGNNIGKHIAPFIVSGAIVAFGIFNTMPNLAFAAEEAITYSASENVDTNGTDSVETTSKKINIDEIAGIDTSKGLTTNSDGYIQINKGEGLTFSEDGKLKIELVAAGKDDKGNNIGSGLTFDGNALRVDTVDNGFKFHKDGRLELNTGNGLTFNNNALTVNAGKGLTFDGNALTVNAGDGLAFNENTGALDVTKYTTVSGDKNLTVIPDLDGTPPNYQVTLNNNIYLGGDNTSTNSTIKLRGKSGTATIGGVDINNTYSDGNITSSTITGLTNTTWNEDVEEAVFDSVNGTNGADKTEASKAATQAQLLNVSSGIDSLDDFAVKYDPSETDPSKPDYSKITLKGDEYNFETQKGGTTIDNLRPGKVSEDSTEAINGSQLYATNQNVTNLTNNVTKLTTDVTNLTTDVNTGWDAQVNGTKAKTVNPDNNTLNFVDGDNTKVTATEDGSIKISTDLSNLSAEETNAVVYDNADKTAVTLGGNRTYEGGTAGSAPTGGVKLTNVAYANTDATDTNNYDGSAAVNVDLLKDYVDENGGGAWNLTTNGETDKAVSVGKDKTVDFSSSEDGNITVAKTTENGNTKLTFGLSSELNVNEVTTNNMYVTNVDTTTENKDNSVVNLKYFNENAVLYDENTNKTSVTLGGKTYDEGTKEGGTRLTNVAYATGKDGSEAVNVDYLNNNAGDLVAGNNNLKVEADKDGGTNWTITDTSKPEGQQTFTNTTLDEAESGAVAGSEVKSEDGKTTYGQSYEVVDTDGNKVNIDDVASASTLKDVDAKVDKNTTNIGNLEYNAKDETTNIVNNGDNLTTAVGKLDNQVTTNTTNINLLQQSDALNVKYNNADKTSVTLGGKAYDEETKQDGTHLTNVAYATGDDGSEAVNVDYLKDKVGNLQYNNAEGDSDTTSIVQNGDDLTTAIGKLDNAVDKATAEAAKHTTVSGDENISVNHTAGSQDYKVSLKDNITLGDKADKKSSTSLTFYTDSTPKDVTVTGEKGQLETIKVTGYIPESYIDDQERVDNFISTHGGFLMYATNASGNGVFGVTTDGTVHAKDVISYMPNPDSNSNDKILKYSLNDIGDTVTQIAHTTFTEGDGHTNMEYTLISDFANETDKDTPFEAENGKTRTIGLAVRQDGAVIVGAVVDDTGISSDHGIRINAEKKINEDGTVSNDNMATITGLENTEWKPTAPQSKIATFAENGETTTTTTTSRAATEAQLDDLYKATAIYTTFNSNGDIDYSTIKLRGNDYNTTTHKGGTLVTNVAYSNGNGSDAVNVDYLNDAIDKAIEDGGIASGSDKHLVANTAEGSNGIYKPDDEGNVDLIVSDEKGNSSTTVTIGDVASKTELDDLKTDVGDVSKLESSGLGKDESGKSNVVDAIIDVNDKVGSGDFTGTTNITDPGNTNITDAIKDLDSAISSATSSASANRTEIKGDKNIVVTDNGTGNKHNYQISLNDQIDLGNVDINGEDGTISTTGNISGGSFTSGDIAINKDNSGLISGLHNTSWDWSKYDKGDYSSSSNAATEAQLHGAMQGTVQYDRNEDGTVNKNSITLGGGEEGTVIHNVASGTEATDAANMGQLAEVANTSYNAINNMGNQVNRLSSRIDKVGAGAAALAALHPLDFDPDDKLSFAAGYGNYAGENAVAVGAFYQPNEDTMFSLGGTFGNDENMINAGVSFKLGQKNHVSRSRVSMAKELISLRDQVSQLKVLMAHAGILPANGYLDTSDMFPDIPQNHWAYEYVHELAKLGIVEGYPDGNYGGDRMMTRYEMAAIIYRAMQKGVMVDSRMLREFEPELKLIRVDVVAKDKNGNPTIERVRVNEDAEHKSAVQ